MAGYIDFVDFLSSDRSLGIEFSRMLKKSSAEELSGWFVGKGFRVGAEECEKILKNGRKLKLHAVAAAWPY